MNDMGDSFSDALLRRVVAGRTKEQSPTGAPQSTYETRELLLSFLDVLDSVDRLAGEATAHNLAHAWQDAVSSLRAQIVSALEQAGIEFFGDAGQPFDPSRHRALDVVARPDIGDHHLERVVTPGCTWRGQVLRHAEVIISRSTGQTANSQERGFE